MLPDGADPDEFIRTHGVEAYQERRGRALPHIQFVLDQAVRDRNLLRPADKAAAVEEALPFVRAVRNPIQKREYFDMTMNALRIEETALRRELWQTVKSNAPTTAQGDVRQRIVRANVVQPTFAEQKLLELLIHDEEVRRRVLPQIEAPDYEELPSAPIFRAVCELDEVSQTIDFDSLSAKVEDDDEEAKKLLALVWWSEPQRERDEAEDAVLASALSCLNALRLMMIDRRINELGVEIANAERTGDTQQLDRLALEQLEWARRKKQIMAAGNQISAANN